MIYMWFTGMNYYKLAVEKDCDSIFTTLEKNPYYEICNCTTKSIVYPSYFHTTGCIKKTEQIWNCSQFRKTAISIQFLMYIASLGTYNVE